LYRVQKAVVMTHDSYVDYECQINVICVLVTQLYSLCSITLPVPCRKKKNAIDYKYIEYFSA